MKIANFWRQTLVILQDLHRISFHAVCLMGISRHLGTENYTSKVVTIQKSLRRIANFSSMIFRAKKNYVDISRRECLNYSCKRYV